MGEKFQNGFTIIETVLFLAISGLLVVGILASTGTSIAIQRYRDSVTSFHELLRSQYTQVDHVANLESKALACTNAVVTDTGSTKPRGQSTSCILIGRYIKITDTDIETASVVASGSSDISRNDIADLQTYVYATLPGSVESRSLEWGTRIAWPKSGDGARNPTTPRSMAILILKSPISGLKYTFTSDSTKSSLQSMVIAGDAVPGQGGRRICVAGNGLFDAGLAIVINSYASNSNAIEIRSNDMGDSSKC